MYLTPRVSDKGLGTIFKTFSEQNKWYCLPLLACFMCLCFCASDNIMVSFWIYNSFILAMWKSSLKATALKKPTPTGFASSFFLSNSNTPTSPLDCNFHEDTGHSDYSCSLGMVIIARGSHKSFRFMTRVKIRKSLEQWWRSWPVNKGRNQSSWVKARNKILIEAGDLPWGLTEMGWQTW